MSLFLFTVYFIKMNFTQDPISRCTIIWDIENITRKRIQNWNHCDNHYCDIETRIFCVRVGSNYTEW